MVLFKLNKNDGSFSSVGVSEVVQGFNTTKKHSNVGSFVRIFPNFLIIWMLFLVDSGYVC